MHRSPHAAYLPRATPAESGHVHRPTTADPSLVRVLALCGASGDFLSPDALAVVRGFARRSLLRGLTPAQVAASVRRSLAAAAPAAMTVVTFETVARHLVRHAMDALLDD